ncbi:MAG TPA: Spy/CpxP family protein refolding chaperone [Pseudolabrys sp.]
MVTPQFTPRVAPQRTVTPQFRAPQHTVAPVQRQLPTINRTVRQDRHIQQRQLAQPTIKSAPNLQAQTKLKTQQQLQLNTRQQLRAERALRRTENRELRRLPPSQRALRREQIQQARQQRALTRQQLVQPNILRTQPDALKFRANRRNGDPRLTADAAQKGRFASRFTQQAGLNWHNRFEHTAAHRAWRHGRRAAFVAWYGPVFWPYAYSDIFDYAFWPYGYDDGYWAYAYDDFFDGVFWGEVGPPEEYAYGELAPQRRSYSERPSYSSVQELCRQPGSGVTAWPFADIERKVGLNADQSQLLGDVRKASQDAAAVFKASCPPENAFPLTPPGRLAAMTARLDATLQAVQTVRPALEKFYDSLSDEQQERFNQLGPKSTATNAEASEALKAADACKQPKQGLSNLPIEKIEDAVNPTDAQVAELNRLQDATTKAVSILQAACPDEIPITPPGRLDAMEKRLQAMIDAAKTVKPALESFYASLTSEQKARFNRIGRSLAETTGQSSN